MKYTALLAPNNRSRAYLQTLVSAGYPPEFAILLDPSDVARPENRKSDRHSGGPHGVWRHCRDAAVSFVESEPLEATLTAARIPFVVLDTMDVNADVVIHAVRNAPGNYILYSGPGAVLLRKPILSQQKHFIHAHSGWLPTFRGSTTGYYSMLVDGSVGCSIFLMNEEIDAGTLLLRERYQISEPLIDYDYVLDPCIRAATLRAFFRESAQLLSEPIASSEAEANTFYIIHPVLKHLAILAGPRAFDS